MGTRGTMTFVENGKKQLSLYSQYDSYIEGVGEKIFNFIESHKIVNGISLGEKEEVSNGFDDFILQFIRDLKNESKVGNYYLYQDLEITDIENGSKYSQEYNYIIEYSAKNNEIASELQYDIKVKCYNGIGNLLYERDYENRKIVKDNDYRDNYMED